jgi:hypothetical protein
MIVPENFLFFSYDGDSVGRRVGRATMSNDLDELTKISELIHLGHELVRRWVKNNNGIWINGGGDEGIAAIPKDQVDGLEQLRKDYEYLVGHTISIGVGKEPSESGRALLIAKLKGKNRIVTFGKTTEKEIIKIKKRAKKGAFKSMEEHKLAEAYLKKAEKNDDPNSIAFQKPVATHDECKYCQQTDGVDPDHCKYCHDADPKEVEEKCKYCSYDNPVATTRMDLPEMEEQDCQFCREMDEEEKSECKYCNNKELADAETNADGTGIAPNAMNPSPDSHNDFALAGSDKEKEQYDKMGMNPPIIGKPIPSQQPPIGQNPPMDVLPKDQEEASPTGKSDPRLDGTLDQNIDPEDNHSKTALQAIAQQIEQDGKPLDSQIDAVDDTDLPTSNAVEGNISRPEDFDQDTPSDMGEEGPTQPSDDGDPEFSDILEEGLNQHADGIQKEKVIQIVSQALVQFKNCKQSLENIKMQDPQLYQASISMLKAMIEMASLLGLGQSEVVSGQSNTQLGQEQAALMPVPKENPPQEEQNDEWHDPFPTHPDHGGEPKPGHAPSASAKEDDAPSPQH